jgi:hypothetical protein
MSRWTPCRRRDFVRRLRVLGFAGLRLGPDIPWPPGCRRRVELIVRAASQRSLLPPDRRILPENTKHLVDPRRQM